MNFNYKIKKTSRRKTISIIIKEGFVLVLSPKYIKNEYIYKILINKENWIKKKLQEQKLHFRENKRYFKDGETFFYLGEKFLLSSKLSKIENVEILESKLLVNYKRKNSNKKNLIEKWYKKKIEIYIELKLPLLANQTGTRFNSIKIEGYKRKLGSCNLHGDLAFNWKIVMLPKKIIDYIIVHELCHTKYFNHSKDFWNMVKVYIPEYKNYNFWLKKNTNMMKW